MSLLAYSGITTKVRAMKSHLLTDDQFRMMATLEDVRSAADYLKQLPAYADFFKDLDDSTLHRGYVEQLLIQSEYRDFSKLYRFSGLNQRKFLDLYFMHYEIRLIKKALRHMMSQDAQLPDLSVFRDFYRHHSIIDPEVIARAEDMPSLLDGLQGTAYYDLLIRLSGKAHVGLYDYELQLDLFYFKTIWKRKKQTLSKKEQLVINEAFGSRLDLLNIQWIYRGKKYYQLSPAQIYALLIPIHYRIKNEQLQHLVEASTVEDFLTILKTTFYGKDSPTQLGDQVDVEGLYPFILGRIHEKGIRKHPYSIAILDSYLYFKECERHRIITTLEGIRYGLSPKEIADLTLNP